MSREKQIEETYIVNNEQIEEMAQKALANAKAEVVREIDRMCIDFFGNFNHTRFIELKKKYTEEK